jgi:cyclopropane-fatty-acyl-phospholipid synthase
MTLGDGYAAGSIRVEGDLARLLEAVFRASEPTGLLPRWISWGLARVRRRNTRAGSQRHIHHHYDIGNDFYRLWLDERLVYTCAYFSSPEISLEQAQLAKMDHVCRKAGLQPGQRVVEAGCGWGSLALHMARHYGVTVRAFNISHEQIDYARAEARRQGLSARVEFIEDDYRNIHGTYDAFVSVGMLEHVGPEQYQELGRVIDRSLTESGRGLVHSIGRNRARETSAWIVRRIFPGAYIPSLREILEVLEPHDLSALDVENLRLHYARTLQHWLDRFEKSARQIEGMFDEAFVRAWRLYLCGSIASFLSGNLQLFQVAFARGRNNDIPWTRRHLYTSA